MMGNSTDTSVDVSNSFFSNILKLKYVGSIVFDLDPKRTKESCKQLIKLDGVENCSLVYNNRPMRRRK